VAKINVGAAIGAGFGLIGRRPVSVVSWGLLPMALQAVTLLLLAPFYLSFYAPLLQSISAGGGPPAVPVQPPAQLLEMEGLGQLVNLVQLLVSAVIYCAVFRAVIHPRQSAFAYMRLSPPEFFMAALIFAAGIATFFGVLVLLIPVAIVGGIVGALTQSVGVAFAVGLPIYFALVMIGLGYLGLRFSLVGPMMVADRKFHLFESWTMTRGHVGSLLLIALGLLGVFILFEIVVLAVLLGVGVAAVTAFGGVGQLATALAQSPVALAGRLWPFLAAYLLLMIPVAGCGVAIAGAPWARAYEDLQPDHTDVFA
jgi:hypothetical protein